LLRQFLYRLVLIGGHLGGSTGLGSSLPSSIGSRL